MENINSQAKAMETQAKAVEKTAAFIEKASKARTDARAKSYDFSWKGGAGSKFGASSGNFSQKSGFGQGGGFGRANGTFQRTINRQIEGTNRYTQTIETQTRVGGKVVKSSVQQTEKAGTVRKGSETGMFQKVSPGSGSSAAVPNQTQNGIYGHGGNLASYTDEKFSQGGKGVSSAGGGKFGAGGNFAPAGPSATITQKASVSSKGLQSLKVAVNTSNNNPRIAQTGAYTRTPDKLHGLRDVGKASAELATSQVQEAQAVQGYHQIHSKTKMVSDMTGLTSLSKAAVRRAGSAAIGSKIYSTDFDTGVLDLGSVESKKRVDSYRTSAGSFSSRKDLAHNKAILEEHFRDLKLDVRSLDTIRLNKLIRGDSIGLGGKRFSLANDSDRLALMEYKKLSDLNKKFGSPSKPLSGLGNVGKAWVNTTVGNSDAGQGLKVTTAAYRAGKVSVRAGMMTTKATTVAALRVPGMALSAAAMPLKGASKVGMALAKSASAKAKWGAVSNAGSSLAKASKVFTNASGRVAKFRVSNVAKNVKYRVGQKVFAPILSKSRAYNALKLLQSRLLSLRTKLMNTKFMRVLTAPVKAVSKLFALLAKVAGGAMSFLIGACLLIIVAIIIISSFFTKDSQYDGEEETINDTVLQQAVDFINGYQTSYEYNLFCCDANLPPDQREIDLSSGVTHASRGLPEKWIEQMDAWLDNGTNAEPGEDPNNITRIYDSETGEFVGYDMRHYWGPEAKVYKYDSFKYGAETETGYKGGFRYFQKVKMYYDEEGNLTSDNTGNFAGYEVHAVPRFTYQIRGIGSLEKFAGDFTVQPPVTDTNTPLIEHDSESYQYNGEKENTDASIRYVFRGSQYSYEYTKNKSLFFEHVDGKHFTDYSREAFYKNMVAVATAYTGNMEEAEGGFYKDYMWELFDQNCNGKKDKGVKNEHNERALAEGHYEEDDDDAVPTYAKISIRAKLSDHYPENPYNDGTETGGKYFIDENDEEAGNRPSIYYAGVATEYSNQGTGPWDDSDGHKVGSWEDSAIRWTYSDPVLAEAADGGISPLLNQDEVNEWVSHGYLHQRCWTRSCESYPELSISFFYCGVPDMFYLLDSNQIVDNEWTHK